MINDFGRFCLNMIKRYQDEGNSYFGKLSTGFSNSKFKIQNSKSITPCKFKSQNSKNNIILFLKFGAYPIG